MFAKDRCGELGKARREKCHVRWSRKVLRAHDARRDDRRVCACGIVADRTAYCWGDNGLGQLGDGTTNNSALPVAVSGVSFLVP